MIVYEGIKLSFLQSVENDQIALEIEENILEKMGRHTPKSEFRSWENSLTYMYKVLNDDQIPVNAGIAIEYNIPQTSKRVDFLISGLDAQEKEGVAIVELKQWDKITPVEGVEALVETFTGGANRRVVHPSYQAWSYAQLIRAYTINIQKHGFNRESAIYILEHPEIIVQADPLKLSRKAIDECKNQGVKNDAELISYNIPELFV